MVEKDSTNEELLERFKELSNSRDLYAWRISDYPEVKTALNHIFDEMKSEAGIGKRYAKKYRNHIRVIVLDLFVANQNDPTSYITFSRNSNDFKPGTKYGRMHLSYEISKKINDFLIKNAYIYYTKGFYYKDRPFSSKKPRMRATGKLIRLLKDENEIETGMIKWDENEPTLILRDENGNDIDFVDDETTILMKNNLKLINRNLQKNGIFLYIWDEDLKLLNERLANEPGREALDQSRKRLTRIFNNGSFEQGGRFYGGWWQNIPRECRKYIRLNDKDVVELDFSGLHINMLYAIEKLPMPEGDVYYLDEYSNTQIFRDFVKKLLQAVINAPNREKARKSLHKAVHYDKDLQLPHEILSTKREDMYPLMDSFERKHDGIKHYFCTGKGIDLQFLDSQISEKVMLHFAKEGYAILPLHDSFIIHHALENELKEAMEKAFYEIFNVKCSIDLKYRSIEKRQEEEEIGISEPDDPSFDEIFESMEPYSIYYKLLDGHWNYSRKT
jgi:hypothetical protein